MASDLCMVADFFPPEPGNRSRRMFERARFLARRGRSVSVLAPARPGVDQAAFELPAGLTVARVAPLLPGVHPSMNYAEVKKDLPALLHPFSPLLGYPRWIPSLLRHLRRHPPDPRCVLYTPSNPVSLHLAGVVARRHFAGWIAELRDPITNYSSSVRGAMGWLLDAWIERRVMASASRILLRKGLQTGAEELRRRHPTAAGRIVEGPDYGIDLEELQARLERAGGGRADLGLQGIFAGNFYAGQTPVELCSAVRDLRRDGLSVGVRLFGRRGFESPFPDGCEYGGEIPYWTLMDAYAGADFAIVFLSDSDSGSAGFVPSKLAELVALRKPILAIGPTDSEISRLIVAEKLGVVTPDDRSEIRAAIESLREFVALELYNPGYFERMRRTLSNEPSEQLFLSLVEQLQQAATSLRRPDSVAD